MVPNNLPDGAPCSHFMPSEKKLRYGEGLMTIVGYEHTRITTVVWLRGQAVGNVEEGYVVVGKDYLAVLCRRSTEDGAVS